ncbi:MAG: MBL fold metallo-hydrolase [Acidobacteriia bacterium]|nr:MBL fold metallo-hydrolase [Terriglobia bacterium]
MLEISRRELFGIVSSLAPAFWLTRSGYAQAQPALQLQPLGDKLTLLSGAGGNIAILQGADGLLLVDSGLPQTAEAVDNKARSVAPVPIATLINTHFHFDHIGANERLGRAGVRIIAHDNVLKRLSTPQKNAFMNMEAPALAPEGRPKTTFSDKGQLTHGGEKIAYKYLPPAHTDGDTTVHFTNANVYHAGDLFFNGFYPFIDYSAGGNIEGMVADADRMIEAVDRKTKIIPGHGPMATLDELRVYRDMLADVNEKVSKLVRIGKTLEETQAAEPTKAHDDTWGKGFLKPADFVRMLYAGKTAAKAA